MSKKNGPQPAQPAQPVQAEKPEKPNGIPQAVRPIRKEIRKDMRAMYQAFRHINKDDVLAKYLAVNPEQEEYFNLIVDTYTLSLEGRDPLRQEAPAAPVKPAAKNEGPKKIAKPIAEEPKRPEPARPETSLPAASPQQKKSKRSKAQLAQVEQKAPSNAIMQDFKDHLEVNQNGSANHSTMPFGSSSVPPLESQMQFMSLVDESTEFGSSSSRTPDEAVLLSPAVERIGHRMPPQFALLGQLKAQSGRIADPRVMLNTNIPFSAFICGLQGSGKSHTTSCIIENCSLAFPALGTLKKPLSTLVLHYNEYSSTVSSQPSETAFLSSVMPQYSSQQQPIPVRVLVSPSNFHNLKKLYSQIPNVDVRPFRLQPHHLSIGMMLSLMALGKNDSMPLYMGQLTKILREMAMENGGGFDYLDFRARLKTLRLDKTQAPFLDQRLGLLDSFLDLKAEDNEDYYVDGGVTILDLSCPFMDQTTTCILFRIAIDLFLHSHPSRGKMIVADEAHKYMTDTPAAKELTETFLNIIRQQRHLGVRTIISTQEPTISPRLIDLCSITIIHRFSSPEWYKTIQKHVTIGEKPEAEDSREGLYQISSLRTGEALVFAPSAYLMYENQSMMDTRHATFKMMVRKRITWDGGRTIMAIR